MNPENPEDSLFSSETNSPFTEAEIADQSSPILELPKHPGRFSQTSQAILEELRVGHRRLDMTGSSEIAPPLLMTLDKVWEALQKEVQLPNMHKTEHAIDEAIAELSDVAGNFKSRSVYFYPFLKQIENAIGVRIALVAPQKAGSTDILPYRRACFKYSQELVAIIFKNLSNQEAIIEEQKPGARLLVRDEDGDLEFFPRGFSFEADLGLIINKGFAPYKAIPIPDFITDAIKFGLEKKVFFTVTQNYHILIPAFSYVEVLLNHVAIQLDALADFVFYYIRKFSKENQLYKFLDQIDDLEGRVPNSRIGFLSGGWKIAYEFITLLREFPFDLRNSDEFIRVKTGCLESVEILENFLTEVQAKGKDIHEEKYNEILAKVKLKIKYNTEKNLVLTPVDVELELAALFSLTKTDKTVLVNRLVADLSSVLGCFALSNDEGRVICYSVDQRFMNDVILNTKELNLKNIKYKRDIAYLASIQNELMDRKDTQLNVLSLNKDLGKNDKEKIAEKKIEIVDESEIESEEDSGKEAKKEVSKSLNFDFNQVQNSFNIPAGLITLLLGSVISLIVSITLNQLSMLLTGVFLSVLLGLFFAYFMKESNPKSKGKDSNVTKRVIPQVDSFLNINKAAEAILFPKKFTNVFEKVYDPKKLRNKIEEQLDQIKALIPPNEREREEAKMIAKIESAVMQNAANIRIPEDIQIKGRARELIVSKVDLKTLVFRDKLAEHFRKEASVYKTDQDMMSYLNFLIREIEFGYTKYLKS